MLDIRWRNKIKVKYIGIFIIILNFYIKSFNSSSSLDLVGDMYVFIRYFIPCIFFIYLIIAFLYVIKKIYYFNYILKSTEKIAKGDFSIELKEKSDRDLARLARNINFIRKEYEIVSQERMRNEKLKTELILNVSKDLKIPLTSIMEYIKLYRKNEISKIEKEKYLKIILSKSKRLKVLIEDLFEISKITSGKMELHKEKIDIVDLIYQVIGEYSSYYCDKNIKFTVNSFNEEVILSVDGEKISRLIGNLISNALKYSMKNTRVYISIERNSEKIITISVKNVSLSELDFNPLEILGEYKIKKQGMGLAIAKGIVELHGGKIHIEKEADLFKVYIDLNIN